MKAHNFRRRGTWLKYLFEIVQDKLVALLTNIWTFFKLTVPKVIVVIKITLAANS